MRYFIIIGLLGLVSPIKSESNENINCDSALSQYEMNICSSRSLYKNDLELKEEIGDVEVYKKWKIGREAICQYYSGKQFEGGSIRPMMQNGCNLRLNSEAKRYSLIITFFGLLCLNRSSKTAAKSTIFSNLSVFLRFISFEICLFIVSSI